MGKDINRIMRGWKNILREHGTVAGRIRVDDLKDIGRYLDANPDGTMPDILRECLLCATSVPVDDTGLLKAIRRYMRESGCFLGTDEAMKGITERFRHEKVGFMDGRTLWQIDVQTEGGEDGRKVRRMVEKRACQAMHRAHGRREGNSTRSRRRRAVSYSIGQIGRIGDARGMRRETATHWAKVYDVRTGSMMMRPKKAYGSLEKATTAAEASSLRHPACSVMTKAYRCCVCGRWHVGHTRINDAV